MTDETHPRKRDGAAFGQTSRRAALGFLGTGLGAVLLYQARNTVTYHRAGGPCSPGQHARPLHPLAGSLLPVAAPGRTALGMCSAPDSRPPTQPLPPAEPQHDHP